MLSNESAEFLVYRSRICSTLELVIMSTNTQHVTLISPKMSNDDDKKSNHGNLNVHKYATCDFKISFSCYSFLIVNCAIMLINNQIYRLMNVLCHTKAIFADFGKSPK